MKRNRTRLNLNTETIRLLTAQEIGALVGAVDQQRSVKGFCPVPSDNSDCRDSRCTVC